MTKRLRITLTLLLCACLPACMPGYPVEKFPNVKVYFVNDRTGWIVGPQLFRTLDGGSSWKKIRSDGPGTVFTEVVDNHQQHIQFLDERIGFMLRQPRAIYKTEDGGETWIETVSPAMAHETETFDSIFFLSPTKGWVIGRNVYYTDDGAKWTRVGPTPVGDDTRTEKPRVAEGYPPAVSFLNDRSIVLARKDGDVYRSDNGGAKWERVWSVNNYLINVYFFDDKAGWIVGANGFLGRTTDGGASWQQIKVPSSAYLNDVFFLNDRKGWIVGSDGVILYTTDGGTTWLTAHTKANARLSDVWFVDEKRGWAIGGNPFDDIALFPNPSNLILETHDGGQTWSPLKL